MKAKVVRNRIIIPESAKENTPLFMLVLSHDLSIGRMSEDNATITPFKARSMVRSIWFQLVN